MGSFIDISGQKFGRWTVLQRTEKNAGSAWNTICECGSLGSVDGYALRAGKSISCGCYTLEVLRDRAIHGRHGIPEYEIWKGMKQRCSNPKHIVYSYYGGRGIRVCEEWESDFEKFYEDVGPRPSPKHTIDRYPNNNGNYEPGNVRWATRSQQNKNRRPTSEWRKG